MLKGVSMFDKSLIANTVGIKEESLLFACPATYFGGILDKAVSKPKDGSIGVTNDSILFVSTALRKKNKIILKIPIKRIISSEVSQLVKEDLKNTNFWTSMSYFAGYGPMATYKKNVQLLKIPFEDENGIKQNPLFSIKKNNEFSKLLYEKMPKKLEKEQETSGGSSLKILKTRFAKGEITKEEYLEMKKELEK